MVGARLRSVRVDPATVDGGAVAVGAGVFGGTVAVATALPSACVAGGASSAADGAAAGVAFACSTAGMSAGFSAAGVSLTGRLAGVSTSISSVSSIWIIGGGGFESAGPGVLAGSSSGAVCDVLEGVAIIRFAAAWVLRLTLPPNGTGTVIFLVAGVARGFGCLAGVARGWTRALFGSAATGLSIRGGSCT